MRHTRLLPVLASLLSAILLFSCSPATQTEKQTVSLYATSAAQTWLTEVYSCADDLSIAIRMETDKPDIYLRLGEPERITSPVYKIGAEEILVAVSNGIESESLSRVEVRGIFMQGNPSAQVWVFSPGEDIQRVFDQLALGGARVTSTARVASGVRQMSAMLTSEPNVVGILPKRALTENMRGVYSVGIVPVLAITQQEPQGAVGGLISCLQK
jgi:hypothetical protein